MIDHEFDHEYENLQAEVARLEAELSKLEHECTDHYVAHVAMVEKVEAENAELRAERDAFAAVIAEAERAPRNAYVSEGRLTRSVYEVLTDVPSEVLRARDEKVWDEGWDACANWWEIHRHGVVRDESNPYRRVQEGDNRGNR